MRAAAALAGLLGGLCWVAAYVVDTYADDGPIEPAQLTWTGVALLAIAVLGAGAGLVSRSATWLRFLVAVCFLALVGSVLQLVRDAADPLVVDAVAGAVAVVVSIAALLRRPAPGARASASRGAHAR
jgi:drug/metabolite transporter (DMT)-like permease